MSKLECTPDGYKEALLKIRNADDPEKALYQFYSIPKGGSDKIGSGRKSVFGSQFLPFAESHLRSGWKRSLEIGYGPGLLVLAAAQHFDKAYGVDIHGANDLVTKVLKKQGCFNFKLLESPDGQSIPLNDSFIDFIYSWTVFMHLGKIKFAKNYLLESYRVLKDGGLAVIYFSRLFRKKKHETETEWRKAIEEEEKHVPYIESESKIQKINLKISMKRMISMAEDVGFTLVETTASTRKINEILYYHGQHGVVLRKE